MKTGDDEDEMEELLSLERLLFDAAKQFERGNEALDEQIREDSAIAFRRIITQSKARHALAGLVEMIGGPLSFDQAKDLRTLLHAIVDTYGRGDQKTNA